MKSSTLIAAVVAFFALLLAPTAAFADPGDYGGTPGLVTASPPQPDGNGCTVTEVTVRTLPNVTEVTLTTTNEDGDVVDVQTKPTSGEVVFTVRVCGTGTFTATATDQNDFELGNTQFEGIGGGSQAGGDDSGDGTTAGSGSGSGSSSNGTNSVGGGLPATGASSALTVGAGLGLLLLLGGAAMVMTSRRRQTA